MRITGRDKLDEFVSSHADARHWIENWIADTEAVRWHTSMDIKKRYASASFLPRNNVVIFNVKGSSYRMEVQVAYATGIVVVRWLGTHAEYTKRMK